MTLPHDQPLFITISRLFHCVAIAADSRYKGIQYTRWRHQMETFSALLDICAGNSPVTGEFPSQRSVTRSFDVFFYLGLNKRLSKQSRGWWFETPLCVLWRHCNDTVLHTTLKPYKGVLIERHPISHSQRRKIGVMWSIFYRKITARYREFAVYDTRSTEP